MWAGVGEASAGLRRRSELAGTQVHPADLDGALQSSGLLGRGGAQAHFDVVADAVCYGKALGGGFPVSACLGTAEAMDAWGASTGEALHTQTFLGNPLGCAGAIAALRVLEEERRLLREARLELVDRHLRILDDVVE